MLYFCNEFGNDALLPAHVFDLNDLPIPSIQIHKKKKSELAFALFRSEVLVLILGALMSAIFKEVGILK